MKTIFIDPKRDLVFDVKVREMCMSCKRFGKKAKCPPYVGDMEYYRGLLTGYDRGVIYYTLTPTDGDPQDLSGSSSLGLHEVLLVERIRLFNEGHHFIIGFGAGSCKLCDACSFPCRKPDKGLVPIEATGIDVVSVMRGIGVTVTFPVGEYFYRIGALFYD